MLAPCSHRERRCVSRQSITETNVVCCPRVINTGNSKGYKWQSILYSAAPSQVAQDGPPGGHRASTGELQEVLDRPGLKLEDVFEQTATKVVATSLVIENIEERFAYPQFIGASLRKLSTVIRRKQ